MDRPRRVAVVVRTHVAGAKAKALLNALSGGEMFDLYVLANETEGPLDFSVYATIPHTVDTLEDMGFGRRNNYFLIHCSDLLLAHVAAQIPGYTHYCLVEFDVHATREDSSYFDRLAAALTSDAYGDVDLACTALRGSNPKWMWHAAAAAFFEDVWACFFPVICVSARGIEHMRRRRLEELQLRGALEATPEPGAENWVFCEAFVPSAMRERGFRMVELNEMLPGSYDWSSFNWGPAWLLGDPALAGVAPELMHPVLEPQPFVEKYFHWAKITGRAPEFLQDLRSGRWALPPDLLQVYEEQTATVVAALPPPEPEAPSAPQPVPENSPRVAVFLRTHVDNAKVRDSIASLRDGSRYDFYILAHEEPGRELDFGDVKKVSHSLQTFRDRGFDAHTPYFLMHCADLLFSFLSDELPQYEHYVLVEYDVLVQEPEDRFFDRFARALTRSAPDLVVTRLAPSTPHWMWHGPTAQVYGEVLASFFPVVALSKRAIAPLLHDRLEEQARLRKAAGAGDIDPHDRMFCEAFTPSALNARKGFVLQDLNGLMPGAYRPESFGVGPPLLLQRPFEPAEPTELIHPVVDEREFLTKGLFYHGVQGTVTTFLQQLQERAWPVSDALRVEFEAAAQAHLERSPDPAPPPDAPVEPERKPERVRLQPMPPYAQSDPLLPPVGVIAEFVKVGGPNIDAWRWWLSDVENRDEDHRYKRVLRDTYPLPDVVNREGYTPGDNIAFWLSGMADYLKTQETVARYGCTGGRIYDFGGGTGRVFRHFAAQSDAWEVWSSDFRLSTAEWNALNFPPEIKVFVNTSTPTLPLPDGYFDLVTAFSVFTHIDAAESQWLLELRRILRVGGLAYISIHDETAWESDAALRDGAVANLGLPWGSPLPPGKTVSTWRNDDPYNCNVFHARDHIERVWGRFFEILEIKPRWVGAQSVVVCRRVS